MNKKLNMVLSCLVCISVLACSVLPVQAINPENCTHPHFAYGAAPEKTEVYDYRLEGHYAQWGLRHECLKCRWKYFTDTSFIFDSNHTYSKTHDECNGKEHKYYCTSRDKGCPYYKGGPCIPGTCPH